MLRRGLGLLSVVTGGCFVADPDPVRVVSVSEVGELQSSEAIQGRDGGGSARLWDRAVFTFGDTVLEVEDEEGQTWHHNSVAWTRDLDASDGIGPLDEPLDAAGAPRHFIAPTEDEAAFNRAHRGEDCLEQPCGARWAVWPGEPLWDAARARALVFYGLIYAEPGSFNFHGVGQSLAIWSSLEAEPERPIIQPGAEHPTLIWGEGEDAPGYGALIVGDELYSFSCRHEGLRHRCHLMAAPLDHVLERDAWSVWTGAGWSSRSAEALALFDGAPIMSLSHNTYLDAFTVVYSAPFSNEVVLRTAPELTGPWSEPILLFESDRGAADGTTYDAQAHAAFAEQGGRVMHVTYSQPTGETWFSTRFPVVRVELLRRRR